jgi:hypothetical protein
VEGDGYEYKVSLYMIPQKRERKGMFPFPITKLEAVLHFSKLVCRLWQRSQETA